MPPTPPPSKRGASSNTSTASKRAEDEEVRPYVIVGDIGKGSFATVYKGYHEETRQQVAIKTVKRDILTAKLFDNLQSEIQILKSLSHRHITKLIDIVRAERHIYLIMEYCGGGDLTNYIKKRGRVEGLEYIPSPGAAPQYYPHPRTGGLDEIVVRSFLRQLARALKFLRHRNLIHRDIKPQNLLLNAPSPEELARGHPLGVPILKVADFGFARSLPNAMMAETLCGSPLYMAPEILRYEKYDAKADLWSVGAVLYEMAVGKPPFRALNHIELLKKIEHSKGIKFPDEDPSSKSSGGGSEELPVPSDVKKLIRALLKRNPVERASFEEFFGSTALAKSKFPRPQETPAASRSSSIVQEVDDGKPWTGRPPTPEHHRVIPPEVLDPKAMIPPSKFNFRRPSSGLGDGDGSPLAVNDALPSSNSSREKFTNPTEMTRRPSLPSHPSERRQMTKPLSTENSFIPGETEEDGMLRREYVLVGDTRAVEFNRAVDELTSEPLRRPLHDRKIPPTPSTDDYPPPEYPLPAPAPTAATNITFPPPPSTMNPPPPLSSSPSRAASNALNRAISLATKKLFGSGAGHSRGSPSRELSVPPSPKRAPIIALGGDGEHDPLEDELLAALEELAQKTDVLTHWADEMYEYVKAVPQKPLPDPTKFAQREGEADKHARRRKLADMEAEYNAVTCVAVYMLLMSFSQKGIDKLRNHQEHMKMRYPDGDFIVSEGFDDALSWFKDHFIKCNDRAALVKTWLPVQYDGPKSWLDQLVYDRALVLSRTAARKELLDQASSPDECEKLYEESLWCLYALQDDLLQTGNPFMDEDRETIATWIKRTKLRLVRCRARMNMNDRDRINDARADQNLADVARIPAPWDAKPAAPRPS
ncbi:Serine/threonine-protein kinase ATG1 [Hypsizygus marmoreus]|uniref:non-specific serine/threonine protein kinase n=1 Tax=Hypsizygus marmoreus TaxID=39966 RepID=A0A369J584_HYPMA|nr:Serine/threonine-protein kinase ATG1 [Hypsizygus marmoreus]